MHIRDRTKKMNAEQYAAWFREKERKRQKRYRIHCRKIGKPLAANMSVNQRREWRNAK